MDRNGFREMFIANVCQRRKKANLTVEELAQRSGVLLEMLEELEQGILPQKMTVDDAFDLAKVFKCKTSELFQ